VNVSLAPASKDRMKRLFYEVAVQNPETLFQEGQVLERVPGYRIYTGKRDDKTLGDLHIIKLDNASAGSYIRARSGMIETVPGKLDFTMLLKDVSIETMPAKSGEAMQPEMPKPLGMKEFPIEFPLSSLQKDAVRVNASMKSTGALAEEVRTWKDTFTGEKLNRR
jgi:hypothetical protein